MTTALVSHHAVILTALPLEYQAVRAHLSDIQEEVHPEGTIYERGHFLTQHQRWEVGLVETRMGNARAAFEAGRALDYFKPQVILFIGIAGGLKTVRIGDVVVATKVYGYESGKVGTSFFTRPEVGLSTYHIVQRAQTIIRSAMWLHRIHPPSSTPSPLPPSAFLGALAAGEKVVTSTSSNTWKLLRERYEDALAVEMEGYGFLQAVYGNRRVEALVIRGISDLLEGKSTADAVGTQEMAARHASAFGFEVLAHLKPEDLSQSMVPSNAPAPTPTKPSSQRITQKTRSGDIIAPIGDHHHITIHHPPNGRQEKDS